MSNRNAHRFMKGKKCYEAEEIVKLWRALAATTWQLTTMFTSSSMGFKTFLWPLWVSHAHVVQRHQCRQDTHAHKIKLLK